MKNVPSALMEGLYIQGLVRKSQKGSLGLEMPVFFVKNLSPFPAYVKKNYSDMLESDVDNADYFEKRMVFKEGKMFSIEDINNIIGELTQIKEQMEAIEIADKLTE